MDRAIESVLAGPLFATGTGLNAPKHQAPAIDGLESTARRQLVLASVMVVVVAVVGSAVAWLLPRAGVTQIEMVVDHARAATLFGAASLGLMSGRWAARISFSFACAALLVLAFATAVSGNGLGLNRVSPVMTTGGAAFAVLLLLGAAAAPEVKDAASFRRLLTREAGPMALLALAALTPVVDAVLMAATTMPAPARMMMPALAASGWLVAGVKVSSLNRPQLGWLPAVLLILALEGVFRASVGLWSGAPLVALGLGALAGWFALAGAAMAARAALVSRDDGMSGMLQDLSSMRDQETGRRAEEVERLHEVRSLLAGLRAATGSLRKYEDSLDPAVRRSLQDAVGEELSRLNHLIDPGTPDAMEDLDLEAVVMSVVVAEREQGLEVTTDLADVFVRGQAAEIATLVSGLLVNARLHAPGSAVRLSARVGGGVVALDVRDWGPGLSAIESARVFERSYRGARPITEGVPGSGLGLYNARKLARQMHGDLVVRTLAGGGCCFVVTLPGAGHRVNWAHAPAQVSQALMAGTAHALRQRAVVRRLRRHGQLATGRCQLIQNAPHVDNHLRRRASDRDSTQLIPVRRDNHLRRRSSDGESTQLLLVRSGERPVGVGLRTIQRKGPPR